jgi:two-component sensor histidine kinase
VIESQRANMGLKLIQDVVATTLGGTVELENENGAKTTVRMQPEMETRT